MSEIVFFDNWSGMLRIIVVGIAAYGILVFMLRISGKRTLSKLNAFDLVITVALGSTLATVLLSATVPLFEGILALALLVFLQFGITWLSVRWDRFEKLIASEPSFLVHDGQYLDATLRRQRVTREEIEAALRNHGKADISEVRWVVLEANGTITVVQKG